MPTVQIRSQFAGSRITEILTDTKLSPMELNIILALQSDGGKLEIMHLIQTVRRSNECYKFVQDVAFYRAVSKLAHKSYVVYQ